MTKAETRAVKIVELQESLDEAKKIISEFVWPPDSTAEQLQEFTKRAARFAGVTVPRYNAESERDERVG